MSLDVELYKVCLSFNAVRILHFAVVNPMPKALQAARARKSAELMHRVSSFLNTTELGHYRLSCTNKFLSHELKSQLYNELIRNVVHVHRI